MRLVLSSAIFAAGLLSLTAGAVAQTTPTDATPPTTATPAPAAVPAPVDDKNAITCRVERPIGSNLGKRICHTAAEWGAMSAAGAETIDKINRDSTH